MISSTFGLVACAAALLRPSADAARAKPAAPAPALLKNSALSMRHRLSGSELLYPAMTSSIRSAMFAVLLRLFTIALTANAPRGPAVLVPGDHFRRRSLPPAQDSPASTHEDCSRKAAGLRAPVGESYWLEARRTSENALKPKFQEQHFQP